MLKGGYLTKHKNVYELHILAKYYFQLGYSHEDVKGHLISFCTQHNEYFNKDEWYKIINTTVKSATKAKFITGKQVYITHSELEYLKQLDKLNEQKVAFVLLVLYKFYNYKKFDVSIEDIFRLSKLNLNSKTKLEILQSLTSKELVDITMGGKRWVKFADKSTSPALVIDNFEDFIFTYLKFIGEKIGECTNSNCNRLFKHTGKNHKMCSECNKEYRRKYKTEKQREYRKK